MSSRWRRFEVLLPLRFNDGRDIPGEWIAEAVLEIVDHFGAASYETQKVEGHWRHNRCRQGSQGAPEYAVAHGRGASDETVADAPHG